MRPRRRGKYLGAALILLCSLQLLRGSCGENTRKPVQGSTNADELSGKEADTFRREAAAVYAPYKSLSVGFTLKGKVNNEELYYEGELTSTATGLRIGLKDAVFLSPLLTLDIGKEKVSLKDHARGKSETIARAEYQWVELFGRSFPVRFFEPLMRGYLPEDALSKDSTFARTPAGEILVRSDNNSFEAAMYFGDQKLKKIFYRDKLRGEILVFHMGAPFKSRIYPQTLKIEHSRANDYLTLAFKGLRVTGDTPAKK